MTKKEIKQRRAVIKAKIKKLEAQLEPLYAELNELDPPKHRPWPHDCDCSMCVRK